MMGDPPLPNSHQNDGSTYPKCPWCGSDAMGDATVTVEQLCDAFTGGALAKYAANQSIVTHCPSCQRPSAVTLVIDRHELIAGYGPSRLMCLTPIRTDADERYLAGAK